MLCIQHGMENGGRISWEKKKSGVSINAEKTKNAPNNVERFKVPTVLMVMFNMCNILLIRVTWNIDFVVMLCLYRNGQLFEYNHFKIICYYCFISILHLFYRTNTTQNMYQAFFFYIKRILDPITSDVMYNVTLFTWQYAPNTRN